MGNDLAIAVYGIAKNEKANVARWSACTLGADTRLVLDTGSTDGTVGELRKKRVTVHEATITPWRFDLAFNMALALLPADITVCVRLDLDEELPKGWVQQVRAAWQKDTTSLLHPYAWKLHADGTPSTLMHRNYIHARHGYCWRGPAHEVLLWQGDGSEVRPTCDLLVKHHHTPGKSRPRIVETLQRACAEYPGDSRWVFYYGRELYYTNDYDQARATLRRYLEMNRTFHEERCDALRFLARMEPDLRARQHTLMLACVENPGRRDPWGDLVDCSYELKDWEMLLMAARRALAITDRGWYTSDGVFWGEHLHDYYSIAAYHAGKIETARTQVLLALGYAPTNRQLRENAVQWMGLKDADLPAVTGGV